MMTIELTFKALFIIALIAAVVLPYAPGIITSVTLLGIYNFIQLFIPPPEPDIAPLFDPDMEALEEDRLAIEDLQNQFTELEKRFADLSASQGMKAII